VISAPGIDPGLMAGYAETTPLFWLQATATKVSSVSITPQTLQLSEFVCRSRFEKIASTASSYVSRWAWDGLIVFRIACHSLTVEKDFCDADRSRVQAC
jgi:hypothetical protein